MLDISNITPEHLQDRIIEPRITSAYNRLESEKRRTDGYIILLLGYARSPFRDFDSNLRIVVGLDEDDIQLIVKQYNTNFVNFKKTAGINTIKDIPAAVYTMGDHEGTLKNQYDNINMKTKLVLSRFVATSGTLRFNEKSSFYYFNGV